MTFEAISRTLLYDNFCVTKIKYICIKFKNGAFFITTLLTLFFVRVDIVSPFLLLPKRQEWRSSALITVDWKTFTSLSTLNDINGYLLSSLKTKSLDCTRKHLFIGETSSSWTLGIIYHRCESVAWETESIDYRYSNQSWIRTQRSNKHTCKRSSKLFLTWFYSSTPAIKRSMFCIRHK